MATLSYILLALTTLLLVNAAPSVNAPKAEEAFSSQITETLTNVDEKAKETEQGPRQKRYFYRLGIRTDPIDYQTGGISAFNEPEDPFSQIYRKLKDISVLVRTQNAIPLPQLPPQFPFYIPVLFVPQIGSCGCRPKGNGSDPGIENRFPEMDDPRQNWGILNTDTDDETVEYNRPISFTPIPPPQDSRPPPPVEHGSSQADANGQPAMMPPSGASPPSQADGSPTPCDVAVLSCCHQSPVKYTCFDAQGCPDISQLASNGNPCNASNILKVVTKYQKYYAQRTG